MFNNLIESKRKRSKQGGGAFSFVAHVALITLAIYATANAAKEDEKPKEEKVDFVEVKKDEPQKPKEAPPPEIAAPPPPKGFQVLTAPVDIPDVLPDIDLTKSVTNESDFTGKGAQGGFAKGEKKVEVKEDQTYFAKPVWKAMCSPPLWSTRQGVRTCRASRCCVHRTSCSRMPSSRPSRLCGSFRPRSAGRR
jgi:periplasmic protein TonB